MLVYTDNSLVDPWLVSNVILENTDALCPLVAVQPVYTHPYTVAKLVASIAFLYERRVYLNMVAGGFRNDLIALGDDTPHDERYERLVEFTEIVLGLVRGLPVTSRGEYYSVTNLKLVPPVSKELLPEVFVSGSSDAGLGAARALGATAIKYPRAADEELDQRSESFESGIRVGVIARETGEQAWRVALERFPEDRKGQITHGLAMKVSDSDWHRQLSELGEDSSPRNPYWLGPFQNYRTFCPYLVGSYEHVGAELARYVGLGYSTFILDVPHSREDLDHIAAAFAATTATTATVAAA